MSAPRRWPFPNAKAAAPVSLPTLAKRSCSRVVVPVGLAVHAQLKLTGKVGAYRGLVLDLAAGGMSVRLNEHLVEPVRAGTGLQGEIEYAGVRASVRGAVVRSSTSEWGVRFDGPGQLGVGEGLSLGPLDLLARIVTRNVELVDAASLSGCLKSPLGYKHFYSGGHLDVRLQRGPFGWWQIVFLEFLASWREGGAIETGVIDRARAGGAHRHPTPDADIQALARKLAQRCQGVQPAHTEDFAFILSSLSP